MSLISILQSKGGKDSLPNDHMQCTKQDTNIDCVAWYTGVENSDLPYARVEALGENQTALEDSMVSASRQIEGAPDRFYTPRLRHSPGPVLHVASPPHACGVRVPSDELSLPSGTQCIIANKKPQT